MGALHYGEHHAIEIPDRDLAHLKLVILAKLRRNEAFAFSIERDADQGSGRSTIWLHPGSLLRFEFNGSKRPTINRLWIEELALSSHSATGLRLTAEPTGESGPSDAPAQ